MILESSYFYLVAIPAVMLYGIAKGGFAGPLAIIGVPLMSLVVSPLQAAAIMLPILCLQDIIAIYSYREKFHYKSLQTLIPGAILGALRGPFSCGNTRKQMVLTLSGAPKGLHYGSLFGSILDHNLGPFLMEIMEIHWVSHIFGKKCDSGGNGCKCL